MSPTRTTEMAYAAAPAPSRTPVELEPPIAVANTLGSSGRPLDPTDAVAVTRESFSPLQSDTSTATGAHRALTADGSTAVEENRGTPPRRPPVRELGAREPNQGEETVDLVHHVPCCRSMDHERWSTVNHTV